MSEPGTIAEGRGGVPLGAWPRVVALAVGTVVAAAVTQLWWLLPVGLLLAGMLVAGLVREGRRRSLSADAVGLRGYRRGVERTVAWSDVAAVELVRPRTSYARPVAHVEVTRKDDPFDTEFVPVVVFDRSDLSRITKRLEQACEQRGVEFRTTDT